MPPVNERPIIPYANLLFEVTEVDDNRIEQVMITVLENEPSSKKENQ
jgi:Mg2+/Co2+ transporter CorC